MSTPALLLPSHACHNVVSPLWRSAAPWASPAHVTGTPINVIISLSFSSLVNNWHMWLLHSFFLNPFFDDIRIFIMVPYSRGPIIWDHTGFAPDKLTAFPSCMFVSRPQHLLSDSTLWNPELLLPDEHGDWDRSGEPGSRVGPFCLTHAGPQKVYKKAPAPSYLRESGWIQDLNCTSFCPLLLFYSHVVLLCSHLLLYYNHDNWV